MRAVLGCFYRDTLRQNPKSQSIYCSTKHCKLEAQYGKTKMLRILRANHRFNSNRRVIIFLRKRRAYRLNCLQENCRERSEAADARQDPLPSQDDRHKVAENLLPV